ncbi:MAG: hypothetical protein H0T89_31050 [Deltaproteobacteria bacterium]|nr:hypothetical protein [Deltaproteobacteria bacterium]MDQ3300555.1 hypothetical protein [Myxococcota bacterium]
MTVGDWDRRQLCADGSCVGVIGPDGTCKVCGRAAPNWGEERKRGLVETPVDESTIDGDDDDDAASADPIAPAAPAQLGDWGQRSLCPDGACVGLIGADGKCKVCGKTGVPGAATAEADEYEDDDEYGDEDEDDEADQGDEEEIGEADKDDAVDDAELAAQDAALAAAADELAGVATRGEVARVDQIATAAATIAEPDDDDRRLCPDGACVGLLGSDGRCKVCGKRAEQA